MLKHGDNRNIRVLQFLDAYEKQESLWNPSLDSYKNKASRDEAYMNIIKELNIPSLTIQDVKLKVKSIRTTYTKELRLLTKHKEEGKPYTPKLFWFNRANTFLKSVSLSRDKRSNFPLKMSTDDYKPCVIDYITDIPTNRQGLADDEPTDDIEEDAGNTSSSTYDYKALRTTDLETQIHEGIGIVAASTVTSQAEEEPTPIKHVHDTRAEDFQQQHNSATIINTKFTNNVSTSDAIGSGCAPSSIITQSQNSISLNNGAGSNFTHSNSSGDDEYDLFCRSVAAQLRSISDTYSRSVAKLKIQQILFEAETGHYRNSSCITFPSVSI